MGPTDKDGGFALVSRDSFCKARQRVLEPSVYDMSYMHEGKAAYICNPYAGACRFVANEYIDDNMSQALLHDAKVFGLDGIFAECRAQ